MAVCCCYLPWEMAPCGAGISTSTYLPANKPGSLIEVIVYSSARRLARGLFLFVLLLGLVLKAAVKIYPALMYTTRKNAWLMCVFLISMSRACLGVALAGGDPAHA